MGIGLGDLLILIALAAVGLSVIVGAVYATIRVVRKVIK
jgi:hypothetical protein